MIIKYKARMTAALILKVFFTVLVSSFASPSRALERISAVLGPSNSSVFGIERVQELSLQITESGDYAFDIVVFQDRTTSSKVNVGNAPPLNHIVTVQSQDEIVKWLSKNKPQIILCFAQDAGLHYTIVNARKNGLLSSDVKIISVLEDVTNYQKKYEQGNANLEQIATVFIYSDLIVFTAAKDQKFLEKELKNGKLDIPNKALLQKVKSGIVLQHFSLIKDFVLPHPKDTTGGNEVWIKQNRIRRDAPNQNQTLGDSNTTMVAYPTPSSTATLWVGASQRVHPNMTYPTASSNATVATFSPTIHPNMTYPTASSNATAMVGASQTVHPNMTYPMPSSNATVAASSTLTVYPNMTYPTSSSNATVVASSPTVYPNMTYPTSSANATVVASSPTVSPNMTYTTPSSNATAVVGASQTVHPNMTYPTPSSNATVVASSPTVYPNMTYTTASSNATVVASSPTVHPNMTYPTPSINATVVASSPTVSPNMTYKTPSSNATAMVGASPTVHPNMTYPMPSSNATVASSSAPTVYPNMTYPTASSNATVVASSPTVHPNMTYPTASSNATVVASSPTVHPNMTYPTASSNATVVASSPTVHPNMTYPTASSNATVVTSSSTVYPNMTYPTSSSTVSLLFQTKSNQTSSVEQLVVSSSTPLSVMTTVSFLYNQSSVRQTPTTTVVPFSSPPTLSTTVSLVISGQSSSVVHPLNATVVVSTSTAPLTSSVVHYFNETVILKTQAVTSLPSVFSTTSRQRMSSTFSPQATSTLLLSSSLSSTGFLSITEMATPSLSSVQITTPSSQAVLPQVTSSVVLLTSSPTGLLSTEEATPSPSSVQIVIPTSSITTGFTPSKDDERYLITFEGNCKDVVENDEKKNKFREEFTKVITDILEITDKELQVEEIKCGSINVTFIVKNAKNRNTTVVLRKAVSEGNVILRVDGTAYTSSGLVVIPSPEPTKPSTGVRPTTKPDNKLALYLYITFGAVMGMIFLIGLIILIIRCRREKTRGTFTLGSDADVELKRFKGIPRASYYRVEMYGEPVEVDAARAGVCEDEYDGNIVPYAQTSFNSNTAAHSSNKVNKDEFTMGNLPEWNVPKLRATDVVVSSPQRTSAAEQSDGEVPRDENANNDTLHAYDNPVMTFGETSNNSSE